MKKEEIDELEKRAEQNSQWLETARETIAGEKGKGAESGTGGLDEKAFQQYKEQHSEKDEYEYLVRGAKLRCRKGSHTRMLNLPVCHGVYIGENPMVHEYDCVQGTNKQGNISWFGVCRAERCGELPGDSVCYESEKGNAEENSGKDTVSGKKCQPVIVGVWQDVYDKTKIADSWEGEAEGGEELCSLTTGSFLVCNYGGIIEPVTSGQEYLINKEDLGLNDDGKSDSGNTDNERAWAEIEKERESSIAECGKKCTLAHERYREGDEADHGNIHGTNYFTVVFQYADGEVIEEQQVKRGESAVPPIPEEEKGEYVFADWDKQAVNVSEDMVVTAEYVLKKLDINDPEAVKKYIWKFFLNAGFTEYMAAGILGNVHVETGGTFNPAIISKSNYRGLFQLGGGRRDDLIEKGKEWAKAAGWSEDQWESGWQDLRFQCEYALNEYKNPGGNGWLNVYYKGEVQGIKIETNGTTEDFRNSSNAIEAAVIWMVSYERCMVFDSKCSEGNKTYYSQYQGQSDRGKYAQIYYDEFCGQD